MQTAALHLHDMYVISNEYVHVTYGYFIDLIRKISPTFLFFLNFTKILVPIGPVENLLNPTLNL